MGVLGSTLHCGIVLVSILPPANEGSDPPMLVIQIDAIYPESREGLFALLLDEFWVPAGAGHGEPELRGEEYLASFLGIEFEPIYPPVSGK
jgi:hypothetical protein